MRIKPFSALLDVAIVPFAVLADMLCFTLDIAGCLGEREFYTREAVEQLERDLAIREEEI